MVLQSLKQGKSISSAPSLMSAERLERNQSGSLSAPGNGRGLGNNIIRSVAFGALRYLLLAPIPFLMTPFILHKIGVAAYGTWAVFTAINGLTSLADLGLVGTLSKFVAEYYALRDFPGLNRVLSSGFALFLFLASAVAILVTAVTPLLIHLMFRGSPVGKTELAFLLRCFLIVIVANILIMLLSSAITGLQRLDITYIVGAANILLSALGSAALLLRGWGLRGLVYAYSASAILALIVYFVILKKLLPEVSINPLRFNLSETKKMFGFSLRLYIIQASVAIQNQVDKVLLALLIGVAPVGWFDIASDVALKVRAVVGLILGPVMPAASELNVLGDSERTKELYYRTHKYLALCGVPVVFAANAFCTRFVELWLGANMAIVALPMSILITVAFVNLTSGPGFLIFAGQGYLKPAIQSSVIGIVLNVIVSLVLIHKFGFNGAALGTAVAIILAALFLNWIFHRETGYAYGRLLRESYVKPFLSAIVAIILVFAVHSTKDVNWPGLVLMMLAFGVVYTVVILMSHFFDQYDWEKMESFLPPLRRARKGRWTAYVS